MQDLIHFFIQLIPGFRKNAGFDIDNKLSARAVLLILAIFCALVALFLISYSKLVTG